jgi:hypothetical protein
MDRSRFDSLSKLLATRLGRRTAISGTGMAFALGMLDRSSGAAQDASPVAGATPVATVDFQILFVQSFASGETTPAEGTDGSFAITLEGGSGQTVYFTNHPERMAGALPTASFFDDRAFDVTDPPNAAIVAETADGQDILVVELLDPSIDESTGLVSYRVRPLADQPSAVLASLLALQVDQELPTAMGPVSLFIDDLMCSPDGSSCHENSQCCSGFCCTDIEICPPWICLAK